MLLLSELVIDFAFVVKSFKFEKGFSMQIYVENKCAESYHYTWIAISL